MPQVLEPATSTAQFLPVATVGGITKFMGKAAETASRAASTTSILAIVCSIKTHKHKGNATARRRKKKRGFEATAIIFRIISRIYLNTYLISNILH